MKAQTEATTPAGTMVAGYGLAILFLINLFNYADRALLGIAVEPIRHELPLTDTQISIIGGFSFAAFYLIAGIAIARWVDRGNRRLILAIGVALWSAATAATGLAQGFYSLAFCRMLVGVGEATVFPVAMSLLSDLYPGPKLSRSVSIFQASSGVGIMTGAILSGVLAAALGWRAMFELFGALGVLLVLLIAVAMRPTARTVVRTSQEVEDSGLLNTLRAILAVPGMWLLAFGYAASNMMLAVLPIWGPAFLLRSHGVKLSQVGALVGPPAVIGGFFGTILCGMLATRLIQRSGNLRAGLIVPIIALPLAVPAFALFLLAPSLPFVMLGIGVTNFMLSSTLGPCVAIAVSLVPPTRRGLTSTLMLIVQTAFAFGLAPLIVGVASDALTPTFGDEGLRHALALILAAPLAASSLLWFARRRIGAEEPVGAEPKPATAGA